MNQNQDNIRTMFDTTVAFLDDHDAIWSGTAAFADAVTRAKVGVEAIDTASDEQQTPTTGITTDKATARDALEEKTLELADQLAALAAKTQNADLGAQVQVTKSSLDLMDDNTLEQTAERVATLANTNMAALADYGVLATDAGDLNKARAAFDTLKTSPREAAAKRKARTGSLPGLIREVRSIFRNEIDKMVTRTKKSEPDFYNGYFAARAIVSQAGSRRKKPAAPVLQPA